MNYTIKLKGGVKNDIPTLSPREIGICTDTNEVFVGTETGNKDFFKVINDKIGDGITTENTITLQMNDLKNNKLNKIDYVSKSEDLSLLNGWVLETGSATVTREGKLLNISWNIKDGVADDSTVLAVLSEEFRPLRACMIPVLSCGNDYQYKSGYLMVYTNGQVIVGGNVFNKRMILNATFGM